MDSVSYQRTAFRKPVSGRQTAAEKNMKISIRDAGPAKIVEVDGDVDLGTSGVLRRTPFAALPETSILALKVEAQSEPGRPRSHYRTRRGVDQFLATQH
jgi:hypothetical protein